MRVDDERKEAAAATTFYARAVDEATEMAEAAALENVDAELALLRMRLNRHLHKHPEDYELMLKSVTVIVRTAQARYRMSPRQAQELAVTTIAAMETLQDSMFGPSDEDDV